jgi:hypothetical protein
MRGPAPLRAGWRRLPAAHGLVPALDEALRCCSTSCGISGAASGQLAQLGQAVRAAWWTAARPRARAPRSSLSGSAASGSTVGLRDASRRRAVCWSSARRSTSATRQRPAHRAARLRTLSCRWPRRCSMARADSPTAGPSRPSTPARTSTLPRLSAGPAARAGPVRAAAAPPDSRKVRSRKRLLTERISRPRRAGAFFHAVVTGSRGRGGGFLAAGVAGHTVNCHGISWWVIEGLSRMSGRTVRPGPFILKLCQRSNPLPCHRIP